MQNQIVNNVFYHYDSRIMSEQMAEKIRDAIRASGLTSGGLSKIVDVKQPTISEFLRGAGISLATAQKLADHFGLVLTEKPAKKKPRR